MWRSAPVLTDAYVQTCFYWMRLMMFNSPPGEGVWFDLSSGPMADHHAAAYKEDHPGWQWRPEVIRLRETCGVDFHFLPYFMCVCVCVYDNLLWWQNNSKQRSRVIYIASKWRSRDLKWILLTHSWKLSLYFSVRKSLPYPCVAWIFQSFTVMFSPMLSCMINVVCSCGVKYHNIVCALYFRTY